MTRSRPSREPSYAHRLLWYWGIGPFLLTDLHEDGTFRSHRFVDFRFFDKAKMHPRATKADMKQMYGCLGCHNPGFPALPLVSLPPPTVTALKAHIRRCGGPIRLHLDRIGCAFRRCALSCGPSPSFPATGSARGGPHKTSAAAGAHTRPGSAVTTGRAMTAPAPTKRGAAAGGARRALRAPPRPFVVSSSRLLLRTSCPVLLLRDAAVRTSSRYGGTAQRRVEGAESPGPPRRLSPCKRGVGQRTFDP